MGILPLWLVIIPVVGIGSAGTRNQGAPGATRRKGAIPHPATSYKQYMVPIYPILSPYEDKQGRVPPRAPKGVQAGRIPRGELWQATFSTFCPRACREDVPDQGANMLVADVAQHIPGPRKYVQQWLKPCSKNKRQLLYIL